MGVEYGCGVWVVGVDLWSSLMIEEQELIVCLEPTAASIWAFRELEKEDEKLSVAGTKYITIDAGGGTVDIMMFKRTDANRIEKLEADSGGGWGSTYIDQGFESDLQLLMGDVWHLCSKERPSGYRKVMDFERIKESFTPRRCQR